MVYCALVSALFHLFSVLHLQEPPQFLAMAFMLTLLVFSAAVCGSLVFGYAVYLAINKEIKSALKVLFYTLLSVLLFVALVFLLMIVF